MKQWIQRHIHFLLYLFIFIYFKYTEGKMCFKTFKKIDFNCFTIRLKFEYF